MQISAQSVRNELIKKIEEISGQKVLGCYQCGKCTAGCPMVNVMVEKPHEIMRLLQLGVIDEASLSHTIWLCASCQTCASRCPKGVDLSRVMEALRANLLRKNQLHISLDKLPKEVLAKAPQQALVSGSRKFTIL